MLGAGEEGVSQADGLANPFLPETLEPFPTRAGLSKHNHEAHRGGQWDTQYAEHASSMTPNHIAAGGLSE